MITAKLMNVAVPFLFKYTIDYLNSHLPADATLQIGTAPETVLTVATSMLIGCE